MHSLPEWRSKYSHLAVRRGRKIANVAMARKLAIQLLWMSRKKWEYRRWKDSVRTRDSPNIAVVCSRTSSN